MVVRSLHSFDVKALQLTEEQWMSCLPKGFKFITKPYLHQLITLAFSLQFDAHGDYSTMGLGKTKSAIDFIRALGIKDGILVVTLRTLMWQWKEEFDKHSGNAYDVKVFESGLSKVDKADLVSRMEHDVYVVNYDSLYPHRGKGQLLEGFEQNWNAMIVDEGRKIMDVETKRAQAIMILSHLAKTRVTLTGLPTVKTLLEIYSQQYVLDHGRRLGEDLTTFKRKFFVANQGAFGGLIDYPRIGSEEKINYLMYAQAIRFTKDECLDLPEKTYQIRYLKLSGDAHKFYEDMKLQYERFIVSNNRIFSVKSVLQKFHQVCGGHLILSTENKAREVMHFKDNAKMDELERIFLDELPDEKIIVVASYIEEQRAIYNRLNERGILTVPIVGGMKTDDLNRAVKMFQTDPAVKGCVMSPKVGGRGLTLTASCYGIFYSQDFDTELVKQTEDRIHRISQVRNVTWIRLVIKNSVDERVLELYEKDENFINRVVESQSLLRWV